MKRLKAAWLLAAALTPLASAAEFTRTRLEDLAPEISPPAWVVAQNGCDYAYVDPRESGGVWVVSGQDIGSIRVPKDFFRRVCTDRAALSPEGSAFAFIRPDAEADGVRGVVEGRQSPVYFDVQMLTSNPDGSRLAFAAQSGYRWRMVIDRSEGEALSGHPRRIFLSPDGRRFGYLAGVGAVGENYRYILFEDLRRVKEWDPGMIVQEVAMSRDGKRRASVESSPQRAPELHNKGRIVIDGQSASGYLHDIAVAVLSPAGWSASLWKAASPLAPAEKIDRRLLSRIPPP